MLESLYFIYIYTTSSGYLSHCKKNKSRRENHPFLGLLFKVLKIVAFGVHQVVPSGMEVEEAVIFATLTTWKGDGEDSVYHAI